MYSHIGGTIGAAFDMTPTGWLATKITNVVYPISYSETNGGSFSVSSSAGEIFLTGIPATKHTNASTLPPSTSSTLYLYGALYNNEQGEIRFDYYEVKLATATVDTIYFVDKDIIISNDYGSGGVAETLQKILSASSPASLISQTAVQNLDGSEQGDIIRLNNVNDSEAHGGGGADYIYGGTLDNFLGGGAGNDVLSGGAGNDTLRGGADNDRLDGGTGDDSLHGEAGNDTFAGITSGALVAATDQNRITGGDGDDTVKWSGDYSEYVKDIGLSWDGFAKGIGTNLVIRNESGTRSDTLVDRIEHMQFAGKEVSVESVQAVAAYRWAMDSLQTLLDVLAEYDKDTAPGIELLSFIHNIVGKGIAVGTAPNPWKALFVESNVLLVDAIQSAVLPLLPSPQVRLLAAPYFNILRDLVRTDAAIQYDKMMKSTLPIADQLGDWYGSWKAGIIEDTLPKDVVGQPSTPLPFTVPAPVIKSYGNEDNNVTVPPANPDRPLEVPAPFPTLPPRSMNNIIDAGGGRNIVAGSTGNDYLISGKGVDSLSGGDGDDILFAGGGGDTVNGNAGDDWFIASIGSGTDTFAGGDGSDTINYSSITAALVVDLLSGKATGAGIGTDTLIGVENVVGGAGADKLYGNALANLISGSTGNDILDGGGGLDKLYGGLGSDTYVLGADNDLVSDSGGANDTITSTISRSLATYSGIETLRLLGTANINATGNALANTLVGNAGNNVLKGGSGADKLYGGAGNDIYDVGGDKSDTIVDSAGIDTINTGVTWSLVAYTDIERLFLTGTANINGTGNNLNNNIIGNAGKNTLNGGIGNDSIQGNAGADILTGGAGADYFVYLKATDSNAAGYDTITDFKDNGADKIKLADVYAGTLTFLGVAGAFTGIGQVRLVQSGSDVNVAVNLDANNSTYEMLIRLAGTSASQISAADFLL